MRRLRRAPRCRRRRGLRHHRRDVDRHRPNIRLRHAGQSSVTAVIGPAAAPWIARTRCAGRRPVHPRSRAAGPEMPPAAAAHTSSPPRRPPASARSFRHRARCAACGRRRNDRSPRPDRRRGSRRRHAPGRAPGARVQIQHVPARQQTRLSSGNGNRFGGGVGVHRRTRHQERIHRRDILVARPGEMRIGQHRVEVAPDHGRSRRASRAGTRSGTTGRSRSRVRRDVGGINGAERGRHASPAGIGASAAGGVAHRAVADRGQFGTPGDLIRRKNGLAPEPAGWRDATTPRKRRRSAEPRWRRQ